MRLVLPLALVSLLLAPAADLPKCPLKHPGRQNRVEDALKKGDAEIAKKVGKHTAKYAVVRFALEGVVGDDDVSKASKATYEFLKWKLGNPAAICAQWVSSGYSHFDKAYSDEGGAALVGFELPGEKDGHSEYYLPAWLVDLLAKLVKEHGTEKVAQALETQYSIPTFITKPILDRGVDEAAKALKRVGFNLPNDYDFPNGLVRAAAEAKANPEFFLKTLTNRINNPNPTKIAPTAGGSGAPGKGGGAPAKIGGDPKTKGAPTKP